MKCNCSRGQVPLEGRSASCFLFAQAFVVLLLMAFCHLSAAQLLAALPLFPRAFVLLAIACVNRMSAFVVSLQTKPRRGKLVLLTPM